MYSDPDPHKHQHCAARSLVKVWLIFFKALFTGCNRWLPVDVVLTPAAHVMLSSEQTKDATKRALFLIPIG